MTTKLKKYITPETTITVVIRNDQEKHKKYYSVVFPDNMEKHVFHEVKKYMDGHWMYSYTYESPKGTFGKFTRISRKELKKRFSWIHMEKAVLDYDC